MNDNAKTANHRANTIAAMALAGILASTGAASAADWDKAPAKAAPEETYPRIESTIAVEIQNDYTTKSQDPGAEINDLFNTTEVETAIHFNKLFSLHSLIVLEPVLDPTPFDDRTFEDHGAFLENLFLKFESGPVAIFAGKFNPSFGTAWDAAPGIYGVDFAEDYELAERIGGGIALTHQNEYAKHVLNVNIFAADTSVLSNSIFTKRGRTRHRDGGPSNTRSPESFSVTLDGSDVMKLPGFSYHLGFRYQEMGLGDPEDERGYVAGIQKEFDLGSDQKLTLLGEVVYLEYVDATMDNRWYFTGSAEFTTGPWNASISHTSRETDVNAGPDVDDELTTASAGYEIQQGALKGVSLSIGGKRVEEDGVRSYVLGFLIAKEFSVKAP